MKAQKPTLKVSEESFSRLIRMCNDQRIQEFLHRYFGLSETESNDLMPQILRLCYQAACADPTVLNNHTHMVEKAAKEVGIKYLRYCWRINRLIEG